MAVAAVLAVATAASYTQQRKARKDTARAAAVERRQVEVRNVRSRQKSLAERLRASAQAEVAGVSGGLGTGSGVIKAEQSSLGAQFGSNVGFAQEIQALSEERMSHLESAGAHSARAGTFQQLGSVVVGGIKASDRGKTT